MPLTIAIITDISTNMEVITENVLFQEGFIVMYFQNVNYLLYLICYSLQLVIQFAVDLFDGFTMNHEVTDLADL